jgi:hypothetical protein
MPTTVARPRARADHAPTSEPKAHSAKLVRGLRYDLVGRDGAPDQAFRNGETVPIDEATFNYLAERAVDIVTVHDGGSITQQSVRKFRLADPAGVVLPKVASETVRQIGSEVEVDPYI